MPDTSSRGKTLVINSLLSLSRPISGITNDDKFAPMLENKVQVSYIKSGNVKSNQGKAVDVLYIAKERMISPDRAKNKSQKKIQHRIRTVMNLQIPRRYTNNAQMLRYPRLPHPLFTDTVIAGTLSNHRNKNSQVYATYYGWTRLFPIKLKSDAHETLPLTFKRDGVLPDMIMNNSKEQSSRDFWKKLREDKFHQKAIEPHSPWSIATDMDVRES